MQDQDVIRRANDGDLSVLAVAHKLGNEFYDKVLSALAGQAISDTTLLALVSYVARHELPVNLKLANAVVESWKKAPDRNSTAKALHIVALSDQASLYQVVVETALQFWRDGYLHDISTDELRALFDGEFWLLSTHTRGSGAGYILKRTLAHARQELANSRESESPDS